MKKSIFFRRILEVNVKFDTHREDDLQGIVEDIQELADLHPDMDIKAEVKLFS